MEAEGRVPLLLKIWVKFSSQLFVHPINLRKMKYLPSLTVLIMLILSSSCSTPSGTGSTTKLSKTLSTLTQSNWQLFSMNGQKVYATADGSRPTLSFDAEKMTVSGNSGCNTFSGGFTAEKDALSFGNLASTRMMCADMKTETEFLSTIVKTGKFSIYEGKLVLDDAGGKQLMSFDPLTK